MMGLYKGVSSKKDELEVKIKQKDKRYRLKGNFRQLQLNKKYNKLR